MIELVITIAVVAFCVASLFGFIATILTWIDDIRGDRRRARCKERMQQARLYESASVDSHRDGRQEAL